jgi:hypothetical protein
MKLNLKALITATLAIVHAYGFSQTNLPIKFKAKVEYSKSLGKKGSEFEDLKSPLNIEFDGKTLSMYYDTGKKWMEKTKVISYIRKEHKVYDRLESEVYIIKLEIDNFEQYYIIEKKYSSIGDYFLIKIPIYLNDGIVFSYVYFIER